MMKLGELVGQKLEWVQPRAFKLEYELLAGDMIAATLYYPRFFVPLAIAEVQMELGHLKAVKSHNLMYLSEPPEQRRI